MDSARIIRWIGSPASLLVHSLLFLSIPLILLLGIFPFDAVMQFWTTVLSMEAIYLAIFIQMSVNKTTDTLAGIEQDIDDIQEDIDDIQEEVSDDD